MCGSWLELSPEFLRCFLFMGRACLNVGSFMSSFIPGIFLKTLNEDPNSESSQLAYALITITAVLVQQTNIDRTSFARAMKLTQDKVLKEEQPILHEVLGFFAK